jgi:hypothetical protein
MTTPGEDAARVPTLEPERLLRVLLDHEVHFVVIGGFSLAAHGVIRGTKDVDVVPSSAPDNLARLAAALRDLEAEVLLTEDFDSAEIGIEPNEEGLSLAGNWALRTKLGRLDVMQSVPGISRGYPALFEESVVVDVPGAGPIRFAGFDHLIAMKAACGRPQDLTDIADLQRARGPD